MEKNYRFDKEGKMNQVDKELMQEKGILTENEKADEYEIQKAAMKEAVFFLAAMLEKNLDMSELQTISLYETTFQKTVDLEVNCF